MILAFILCFRFRICVSLLGFGFHFWVLWSVFSLSATIYQPRSQVLSPTCRETLVGFAHVSPRIWEITNKRLGGGADKCEICLSKRRRRDQWKPCLKGPVFYSSRTSQDKTSNAESFDSESVTSCRIPGCLSDAAKGITDSPLVLSKIF